MKLELKHILPYLDSGLKAVDNQAEPDDNIIKIIGFSNTDGNIEVFDQHGNYDIKLSDIKPILRPLSDLTKEIEVNGEKFVPLEVIGKIIDDDYKCLHDDGLDYIIGKDVSPRCGCPYDCDCMCYTYDLFYKDFNFYSTVYQDGNPDDIIDEIIHESYELVQKLLEWHFDVFGLIEKGLAIDFNETFTQK